MELAELIFSWAEVTIFSNRSISQGGVKHAYIHPEQRTILPHRMESEPRSVNYDH